jgi:hypothetical protein
MMEEQEFQNLAQVGKIEDVTEKVPLVLAREVPMGTAEPQSMEDLVNLLRLTKRNLKSDPATNPPPTPRNFLDQFQFFDDDLFAFINGSWQKIGSDGLQAKVGSGTATADGDQDISCGFPAKAVIMFAHGSMSSMWSAGVSAGQLNTAYTMSRRDDGQMEKGNSPLARIIDAAHAAYTVALCAKRSISEGHSVDGFRLTWQSGGGGYYPITYIYLALG